jgi:hypothetical protein
MMNRRFGQATGALWGLMVCFVYTANLYGQSQGITFSGSAYSEQISRSIETRTAEVLDAIDDFHNRGEFTSGHEPGSHRLLQLMEEYVMQVDSRNQHLHITLTGDDHYEVYGLHVQTGTYQHEQRELILTFNAGGEFVDIRFTPGNNHIYRILNQALKAESEERELIEGDLQAYAEHISRKEMEEIDRFLDEHVLVLTGQVREDDRLRFLSLTKQQYMSHLQEVVFDPNPEVEVLFDQIEVFRDANNPGVYAATVKQTWNTSSYSDEGWLGVVMSTRGRSQAVITSRVWQPEPFEVGRFKQVYLEEGSWPWAQVHYNLGGTMKPEPIGRHIAKRHGAEGLTPGAGIMKIDSPGWKSRDIGQKQSLISKKRTWAIAAAGAVVLTSAALMLSNGSGGVSPAELPGPPGRP